MRFWGQDPASDTDSRPAGAAPEGRSRAPARLFGLKGKFLLWTLLIYVVTGALTVLVLLSVSRRLIDRFAVNYAAQQVAHEKTRLGAEIQRELTLARKLADSPLLLRWAQDEGNADLRGLALEELESYRRLFRDGSYFFVVVASGNYYFNNAKAEFTDSPLRFTVNAGNPADAWFFRTLDQIDSYELNIDRSDQLAVTKVWINVVLKRDGRKVAIGGSGIDLTRFIDHIVNPTEAGVAAMLFDRGGAIEGHRDRSHVEHNAKTRGTERKIGVYDLLSTEADRETVRAAVRRQLADPAYIATFPLRLEGRPHWAALAYLPELGWFHLVLIDERAVLGLRDFVPLLVVSVLAILLIVLIVGWLLNHLVLRPLAVLSRSTELVAAGRYDLALPTGGRDEIGRLNAAFGAMARTIKDHTENLERKVAVRTEELKEAAERLAESNRRITDSIRYAKLIQDSILPRPEQLGACLRDHHVVYRPRDMVGGDFYYLRETDEGWLLMVLDCTGHGVPGAFMSMTAHALLDQLVDTHGLAHPGVLLTGLNRALRHTLHVEQVQDASMDNGLEAGAFVRLRTDGRCVFAGARLSLFRVDGETVTELRGDRQAVGYRQSPPDHAYANHLVEPATGTWFCLTTDGWLDQVGGPRAICFGNARFKAMLAEPVAGAALPARGLRWEQALERYQGAETQRDDITLIAFQP